MCIYCGLPRARVRTASRQVHELVTCVAHIDLRALDPAFGLSDELATLAYPALDLDRAPSLERRESPAGSTVRRALPLSPGSGAVEQEPPSRAPGALPPGRARDGPHVAA